MTPPHHAPRRRWLRQAATTTLAMALPGLASSARAASLGSGPERALAFAHTHTGERLSLVYAVGEHYLNDSLFSLNHFLRDHYSGEQGVMDPRLFDLLHRLRLELGANQNFEVISAYRSPATNERLRTTRAGGVAKRSLHMDGRAMDIRLPGVPLADLREAALSLRLGGVGYYPREQFVHVDTGPVRHW